MSLLYFATGWMSGIFAALGGLNIGNAAGIWFALMALCAIFVFTLPAVR